ncbi:VapC toxin family PIN domain ribonuclease [Thermococcus sp.]
MTFPDSVSLDALALIKMHTASRRRLLEVTLAKFNVSVSTIAIYRYLVSKAYINKNVETELKILNDIYDVIPLSEDIILNTAKIEAKLLKKGIRMDIDDILIGVSAITTKNLLITTDPERYKPLVEFGLDVVDLDKFLREVERIVEEELKK